MESTPHEYERKVTEALAKIIPHLRDVSERDGIQSWDGNKHKIRDILPVIREINQLARVTGQYGITMAPVEVWGGGQLAQPAKFLKEDPLVNLRKIKQAAPNLKLQCLYRGRQAFGFRPVSKQIQELALKAAAEGGNEVVRIFDMMNDITNVETGIKAMLEYNKAVPGKPVIIEAAISYISEPKGAKRAWEPEDYGNYAVDLAKLGCHEIAIKDYAGVGDEEIPHLIKVIRQKLTESGYAEMPINVHSHGEKPEVLYKAIVEAGASKVDVAFGDLSGGPSHTNIMNLVKYYLKEKEGLDVDTDDALKAAAFDNHPIIKQMKKVEEVIHEKVAAIQTTADGKTYSYQSKRPPQRSQEEIQQARMAGGAVASLWQDYVPTEKNLQEWRGFWRRERAKKSISDTDPKFPPIPQNKGEWFNTMLSDVCPKLWEKAGRFNTVTPGALILCAQATQIAEKRLFTAEPILMTDYTDAYLDVVTGRYGKNMGMERGIGDTRFRDAALMFRAIKLLNQFIDKNPIEQQNAQTFIYQANIGNPGKKGEIQPSRPVVDRRNGMIELSHETLEKVLKETDINQFKKACEISSLPSDLRNAMLKELTLGKSEPKQTWQTGEDIIMGARIHTGTVDAISRQTGEISSPSDLAMMAVLLQNTDKKGALDNSIILNLIDHHLNQETHHSHPGRDDRRDDSDEGKGKGKGNGTGGRQRRSLHRLGSRNFRLDETELDGGGKRKR